MSSFRAIVINKDDAGYSANIQDFAPDVPAEDDVRVKIEYSTLNYKDGLAITGASPVVRQFPMVPGIDFAGVVDTSNDPNWKPGDKVVLNGWGCGETHLGGLGQFAHVPGDWLVKLPDGMSTKDAMAIGTAGYTSMLSLMALEDHGVTPEKGEVLVTGATGGVGSIAVALLAANGFEIVATTGKSSESEYLQTLGATEIMDRATLSEPGKPLQRERWAGAIDSVGSVTLANVCAQTKSDGAVAACGLAQGMDFPTTVAPFILRGITLCGINSVFMPIARRQQAWARLDQQMDREKLALVSGPVIGLKKALELAPDFLEGKIKGRVVVDVNA